MNLNVKNFSQDVTIEVQSHSYSIVSRGIKLIHPRQIYTRQKFPDKVSVTNLSRQIHPYPWFLERGLIINAMEFHFEFVFCSRDTIPNKVLKTSGYRQVYDGSYFKSLHDVETEFDKINHE